MVVGTTTLEQAKEIAPRVLELFQDAMFPGETLRVWIEKEKNSERIEETLSFTKNNWLMAEYSA